MHNEVRAAVILITWPCGITGPEPRLGPQREIDDWLAAGPGTCFHAPPTFPVPLGKQPRPRPATSRSPGPPRSEKLAQLEEGQTVGTGPQPAPRRRPCHRGPRGRGASLALLLYGQPLARIARLTRDQVTDSPGRRHAPARHHAGRQVPSPLDSLVRLLRPPPWTRRRRPHQRPSVAVARRSTSAPDLHRPAQSTARCRRHPRPVRTQHRPDGPCCQAPPGRALPAAARDPHQHRRNLGRTGRRLARCLRRTGIPPLIQHVLISRVTNIHHAEADPAIAAALPGDRSLGRGSTCRTGCGPGPSVLPTARRSPLFLPVGLLVPARVRRR